MAVSRNFKNGPLSPMGGDRPPVAPYRLGNGRQGPFCNFFSSNRSLAGDVVQGGRSPPQRATGGLSPPHRATGQGCPI